MNKLYLLIIWTFMSCHSDLMTNKNQPKSLIEQKPISELMTQIIDSIQWHTSMNLTQQDQIAKSTVFEADFDYYECTVKDSSNPGIEVFYDRHKIYFISTKICLLKPHSLEYFDIDDYHGFVELPTYNLGSYQHYSILEIPLKSNLECISKLSVILVFDNHCHHDQSPELK